MKRRGVSMMRSSGGNAIRDLLEYAGKDLFQASIFPIPPNSDKKLELTYSQVLKAESGTVAYRYPLGPGEISGPRRRRIGRRSFAARCRRNSARYRERSRSSGKQAIAKYLFAVASDRHKAKGETGGQGFVRNERTTTMIFSFSSAVEQGIRNVSCLPIANPERTAIFC